MTRCRGPLGASLRACRCSVATRRDGNAHGPLWATGGAFLVMCHVFGLPVRAPSTLSGRAEAAHFGPLLARLVIRHLPPGRKEPDEVGTLTLDQIEVKSYVGGLVRSFERKAA
jgi:hypothetical protein